MSAAGLSETTSTKPYLIRALFEWCVDNGYTPHLLVTVNGQTRVPMAYVKDGEIVLNLGPAATKDLQMSNDAISFSARFSGVSTSLHVPISAVRGIYARESGHGMFFEPEPEVAEDSTPEATLPESPKKPTLTIVK